MWQAEAQGSMAVGVSEGSSVSSGVEETQYANPHGKADVARGTLPMPGFGLLGEAFLGGAINMGWVHSRKDFQFTQKWHSGP